MSRNSDKGIFELPHHPGLSEENDSPGSLPNVHDITLIFKILLRCRARRCNDFLSTIFGEASSFVDSLHAYDSSSKSLACGGAKNQPSSRTHHACSEG